MPKALVRVIDVYPYRLVEENEPAFLLLRRAADVVYAGAWRMVGGKIHAGEAAWQTALRELREETGRAPVCLWALPSVNTFYEWQHDRINDIPVFLAVTQSGADPTLDHEHVDFRWAARDQAIELLTWPAQREGLRAADTLLTDGRVPLDSLEIDWEPTRSN